MIPITRKELYLNKIVGNDNYDIPEKPITTEEFFFAEILGEAVQAPEPLTRYQMYLAKIAGREIEIPYPETRLEYFLARAAGMNVETPAPITKEEIYWSNYTAVMEFEVESVPPLTYKAIEGTLENYRIYGNTVNGESVGDLVESGEHAGEYEASVTVSNGTDTLITPIYLPEQIKKVGDYSDYIDYGSQKFVHRVVRKVFDGTETFYVNATSDYIDFYSQLVSSSSLVSINCACNYFICLGANDGYIARKTPNAMYVTVHYISGRTVMRFYFNDSSGTSKGETAFKSQLADWYANGDPLIVDYIIVEPVEEQVTLPALPTLPGTNVLSVGTAVQPSKVYVKYKGERQ